MSEVESVLAAGGLVPANTKLGKDAVVDTVVARAYRHPVLSGRVVVRLCAEGVAAGDELEMATLGFAPGEDRGAVGKERKRPLGFPGWALVNDPKNARYALDVVKELKKQARKAKSKPGHAKEGFDAIAAKLGKTVPHFLPSFYEEVGRVFIEHGALTYAAAMFGKARQTEAVHALEVDEQHRIDGFLEFALAGAVTTKALSDYAKELGREREPEGAYAHFRQLCLQRTLGGMPPWSGMSKDLGRLAKAAKLDVAKEDAAFVAEIIEAPALAKAACEFWKAYQDPIVALGNASARARGALLNLFPRGGTSNAELDDVWLDLIEQSGAVSALVEDVPEEARPTGGRAAWFDKLTTHLGRHWRVESDAGKRVFDLLRRMAPKLCADGAPIKCTGRWNRIDLDLVELALELGVPVKTDDNAHADCDAWAKQAGQPERGRDPVRAAAHPVIGPKLVLAVSQQIGTDQFDAMSRGKSGFLAAKRAWLEGAIGEAERAALPAFDDALLTIEQKVKASTFAELPDLYERFAALDVAPALARTLRVGIVDEFGWPELEAARLELDPDGKTPVTLHGGPPAVILTSKTRAIAVGASGRLGTHDLVVPPKLEFVTVRFLPGKQSRGDFLVVLKENSKIRCYWATAPHDLWDAENVSIWALPAVSPNAVVLGDGAWLEGTTPMRAGERTLAIGARIVACDGTTAWVANWHDGKTKWFEITATGEQGRISWPAWVEGALTAGGEHADWGIDLASHYFPAPGVTASPLGVANGFTGTRIRWRGGTQHQPKQLELETIDGQRLACPEYVRPNNLLRFPDGETRAIGPVHVPGKSPGTAIYDPTLAYVGSEVSSVEWRYAKGQVAIVPATFLHHYTARDVAGSRYLHAITDDDARALIAAVPYPDPMDLPGAMPEVTHARLRTGVAGLAALAVELRDRRIELARERAPGKAAAVVSVGPDDKTLIDMLGGWIKRQWAPAGNAWAQIERVAAAFADSDRTDRLVGGFGLASLDWLDIAVMQAALGFLATAIGTTADHRRAATQLLAHLGKFPPPEQLRVMQVHGELDKATPMIVSGEYAGFHVRWIAGNAYALRLHGYNGNNYHVLEYAPTGAFANLPGVFLDSELRGHAAGALKLEDVQAAVDAGKTSWSEDAASRLASATGLTPSEATFLWAGCPKADDRSANFLDKELRETLGLKAAQAANARDALSIAAFDAKLAVIDEVARDVGVAALLDGTAADALAAAWKRRFGARVAIPEELIAEADALSLSHDAAGASAAIGMIVGAAKASQLTVDSAYAFDNAGNVIVVNKPEPLVGQTAVTGELGFTNAMLSTLTAYLPFFYAALPVGDALRACAPLAHELALQRLANPLLWVRCSSAWLYEKAAVAAMDRMLEGLGQLVPGVEEPRTLRRIRGGAVLRAGNNVTLYLNPAELDDRSRTEVEAIAKQLGGHPDVRAQIDYVRGSDLRVMMERIATTPVPAGGWEQNPLAAVPKLVDKAAKKLAVSRDAAALYLQYLVLLWPTPKALQEYTGWKPKQLADAQAELVEQELILEAKRERAQRGHFLPGGWEALKSPHPPIETWKLAFYGTRLPTRHVWPTFDKFQAYAPFHLLFERAWARIEAGDKPRYEEVTRGKR